MKKIVVALLTATVGYVVWRRLSEDAADRDLWTEVTDSLD
ncbi:MULTISPECIES: DLW-39 family protein [Isoptericola]|nr:MULTISPECIES: DLW-39 family protein [unclassified Isoptericola]MDO8143748.1 DLW-39 family protein [Isoptericola sp. 178]MDO8147649.1 DLW-39 family protein [Isoptericola sp. b515]